MAEHRSPKPTIEVRLLVGPQNCLMGNKLFNIVSNVKVGIILNVIALLLTVIGLYLTTEANKTYEEARAEELRVDEVTLDAVLQQLLVIMPANKREFLQLSIKDQKENFSKTLRLMPSLVGHRAVEKNSGKCESILKDFREYLLLASLFPEQELENDYFTKRDTLLYTCVYD